MLVGAACILMMTFVCKCGKWQVIPLRFVFRMQWRVKFVMLALCF